MTGAAPDVIIIGSGMGGATLAAALAPTGRRIVILERGQRLENSAEARDDRAIWGRGHYRPQEQWLDAAGAAFNPGNYYYAGGNSKFYGAVLIRYRAEDFSPLRHIGGTTQGWPISYAEIEPWYQKAEDLYQVRGALGQDPSEPTHSGRYNFPAVPDEPAIADLRARLTKAGAHPASLPLGVDIDSWLAGVTVLLGLVDLIAQALLVVLGAVFIFSPGQISQNVHLGAATERWVLFSEPRGLFWFRRRRFLWRGWRLWRSACGDLVQSTRW